MRRTAFFVDGYNLYYGLLTGTPYKWLDLPSLLNYILREQDPESKGSHYLYFTSPVQPKLATRGNVSHQAQTVYIKALKARGAKIITGRHQLELARAPRFIDKSIYPSRQDLVDIWKLEEKETDVSIAIEMYRMAFKSTVSNEDSVQLDQIVLVSADTDMTPALKAIREDFPSIRVGIILPRRENSKRPIPGSLIRWADWIRRTFKDEELSTHQLPERVATHKKPAIKPSYW